MYCTIKVFVVFHMRRLWMKDEGNCELAKNWGCYNNFCIVY